MTICVHEEILQAWLDGELAPETAAAVRSHLASCPDCAAQAHEAEQALALMGAAWQAELPEFAPTARLRARLEEKLSVEPASGLLVWLRATFVRWETAAALAVLAIALAATLANRLRQPAAPVTVQVIEAQRLTPPQLDQNSKAPQSPSLVERARRLEHPRARRIQTLARVAPKQIHVEEEPAELVITQKQARHATRWELETSQHLGQTQLLLRSFRNAGDEAVTDLAYERQLSRELLNRNRLLRRSAEPKSDARAEELLNDIEPLLLDIANLPERVAPDEVRSLKELIREQQVIPALQLYAGRRGF